MTVAYSVMRREDIALLKRQRLNLGLFTIIFVPYSLICHQATFLSWYPHS